MTLEFSLSDVFAGLALLLSIVATLATIRFNSKQKSLIESQELLNKRLLEREDIVEVASRQAEMGANFVKLGRSNRRLKIYNKGQAVARNVTISFADEDGPCLPSDVKSKFPLERLEPMQGVELLAAVHSGSKGKYAVTLRWADDHSDNNEITVYPTL